jgi:hypothetical protein
MKPIRLLPLLMLALLWLVTTAAPAHAESAPTSCAHNMNTHLAGRIVLDLNGDLWPQATEGVAGVSVRLINVHNGASTLLQTVTTNAEGCYQFPRNVMAAGQRHRVKWDAPHPTAKLMHEPDSATAPLDIGPRYEFNAAPGVPFETDVVYRSNSIPLNLTVCPSTLGSDSDLGGMVAVDVNRNRRADAGEGIPNALVTLAVNDPAQITAQVRTDANGCYLLPRNVVGPDGISGINGSAMPTDGISGITGSAAPTDGISGINGSAAPTDGISGIVSTLAPEEDNASPQTTLMFVKVTLPASVGGGLTESYDPNGRQTAHAFREVFTFDNGTFESDFLYNDPDVPTAVTVSTLSSSPALPSVPAPLAFALAGAALIGAVIFLRRR